MADTLKFRGGSTSDIASSTVSDREIVFDTDKNTLVLGSAKDYLMRYGGNSQSGNVGIGVASPSTALDVSGTVTATAFAGPVTGNLTGNVTGNVTGNLTGDVTGDVTGNLTGNVTGDVTGNLTGNVSNDTVIISAGSTERLRINSNGNVGIGTTSPSTKLEVARLGSAWTGAAPYTGSALFIHNGNNAASSPAHLQFGAGNASVSSIYFGDSDDADVGAIIYRHTNDSLNFNVNNSTRMGINSSGNVGIGTDNPKNKLHVYGSGQFTSNLVDTGNKECFIRTSHSSSSVGAGGGILFSSLQGDDSLGMAAIKGLLINGSGNTIGDLAFSVRTNTTDTALSEAMRITSDGNVGIGTSNPTYPLTVEETTPEGITSKFSQGADTNFQLVAANGTAVNSNGQEVSRFGINYEGQGWNSYLSFIRGTGATTGSIAFATSQQEAFRVDGYGRLLVGTSSSLPVNSINAGVEVHATETQSGASLSIARFRDDISPPQLIFGKSRNSTIAPGTIVQNGDELGQIAFSGDNGTDLNTTSARIQAFVDGTPGVNDMPGRLVFATTANGASSPTERMRIDHNGHLQFNHTNTILPGIFNTNTGLTIEAPVHSAPGASLFISRDSINLYLNRNSDGQVQQFRRSGVFVGSISVTTTATAYNTSSDYRLKENVTPVTDGITRLQQLKPSRFNFIADPDKTVDGFIAHEVQTIVPEAITGEKDAVDDDGNPEYQGIDQSKIVPLLTAALQEAIAKIEVLEQRLSDAGIA